jgi:hypothetical protein
MDQYSAGFMCLKNKFPRISDAKIKDGTFVGPQIRELIQEVKLIKKITNTIFERCTTYAVAFTHFSSYG